MFDSSSKNAANDAKLSFVVDAGVVVGDAVGGGADDAVGGAAVLVDIAVHLVAVGGAVVGGDIGVVGAGGGRVVAAAGRGLHGHSGSLDAQFCHQAR